MIGSVAPRASNGNRYTNGSHRGLCGGFAGRRILVEGDERAVPRSANERKGLDYLAARLLNGEPVAPEALEHYGITVRYLGDNVEIIEVPPV